MSKLLRVTSSPHIRHEDSTRGIMTDVIIALSPAAVYGCILFGWRAVLVLLTTVAVAVASEAIWNLALHKKQTVGDMSAVLTGLLLGMNLSPRTPLWIAAIGSVVAIIVVKQMFGGLGYNFANPAITARIVLLVSFASQMSKFVTPFDAVTSATPLTEISVPLSNMTVFGDFEAGEILKRLFCGIHGGTIGETSSFLLIIGGIYLVLRRVIKPIIPLAFIGTVALTSLIAGDNLAVSLFGGGLMLGAIFMATDYVTSPVTDLGKLIFGIGCGLITFVIRHFGSLPEGVSYSILIMNILTPHINRFTLSKPFGFKEVPQK